VFFFVKFFKVIHHPREPLKVQARGVGNFYNMVLVDKKRRDKNLRRS
jgi:hypothetical protein